jgi:hypothetical protein
MRPGTSTTAAASVLLALAVLWSAGDAQARVLTTATNVDSSPTGAQVFLVTATGEQPLGLTPLKKVKLPRGVVTLRFKKDGYQDLLETVEIGRSRQNFVFNLIRVIKPATVEFISVAEFTGAVFTIDGQPGGTVPGKVSAPPGRHNAVVTKDGFQPWTRWFDVAEGQHVTFDVVLKQTAAAKGSILVSSVPAGAEIRLNGAPAGVTPTVLDDLAADQYLVTLTLAGFEAWTQTVAVKPDERTTVDARLVADNGGMGTIRVATDVPTARVSLDGEDLGEAPLTREVKAGKHRLEATAPGLVKAVQEVDVRPGEVTSVTLNLQEATARSQAGVRVVANVAGAQVRIDGGEPLPAPLERSDLKPGTHFVSVGAPGYASWDKTVTLKPGEVQELVAKLTRAGRLRVDAKGEQPAEVFIDGQLVGKTPLIKEDLPVGTYTVLIKHADGKTEQQSVAIGTAKEVDLKFGFRTGPKHRAMPLSAQAIDVSRGTIDIHTGWPWLLGARVSGGFIEGLDLGLSFRSMLNIINEFELHGKYMFARFRNFAVAAEVGLGFGIGPDDRNSFVSDLTLLASLLIAEKAAVTVRIGGKLYSDQTGPSPTDPTDTADPNYAHRKRRTVGQLMLGLNVEFRLAKHWNLFVRFEGDPVPPGNDKVDYKRFMYEQAWGVDTRMYGLLGVSYLF